MSRKKQSKAPRWARQRAERKAASDKRRKRAAA